MLDGVLCLTVDKLFGGQSAIDTDLRWRALCSVGRGK